MWVTLANSLKLYHVHSALNAHRHIFYNKKGDLTFNNKTLDVRFAEEKKNLH